MPFPRAVVVCLPDVEVEECNPNGSTVAGLLSLGLFRVVECTQVRWLVKNVSSFEPTDVENHRWLRRGVSPQPFLNNR
jgi:hypothetical protein